MNDSKKDDLENGIVLQFRATAEKLDYEGNVSEIVKTVDYVWKDYDPQAFLMSTIRNGDLSAVPKPVPQRDVTEFFAKMFDKNICCGAWDAIMRYKKIESTPFNGMRFVVFDRKRNIDMKWVSEDEEARKENNGSH